MTRWITAAWLFLAACGDVPIDRSTLSMDPLAAESRGPGPDGGIAARINNEIITWKDVDDVLKRPDTRLESVRKKKRRDLAEERLFLQAARQNGISVTEQEIDDAVARDRRRFPSEDDFYAALRASQVTVTEYREKARREILTSKLYGLLFHKAYMNPAESKGLGPLVELATPSEIRDVYLNTRQTHRAIDLVQAYRIGLQFSTAAEKEEKLARARSLQRQLEEGADFEMLSHFHSEVRRGGAVAHELNRDRESAERAYPPEIVKCLFEDLKPGEVSRILLDEASVNLFKLIRREKRRETGFEEAQRNIRRMLENENRNRNQIRVRDHLAKSAYIWPEDLFREPDEAK